MNPYGKKNIAGCVWELCEPIADELGYRLWNVEYVREGADMYLRITIDSDDGIDIDDCEKMTRAVDPVIDEADPIEGAYFLEVSSPGVERVLTLDEHFDRMTGENVEVKLYRPIDGKKSVVGTLKGRDEKDILLDVQGETVRIERRDAAKVVTIYDWQSDMKKDKN